MSADINRNIFRVYDIRGSSITDVTPIIAYKVGFCFAEMNVAHGQTTKICVARDGRISSPALYSALIRGIIDGGGEVISIGLVPSPALYFCDKILKPAASIMITASHNAKDDNGFKLLSRGESFFNEQIQDLLTKILATNWSFIPSSFTLPTNIETINIVEQYIDRILDGITINSELKVAWDPGNGAAGEITELLQKKLPNNNIVINSEIDGTFPNHHPDPNVKENMQQLVALVKNEQCDVGIAFDGDGDRLALVSKTGRVILGDQILCILAKDVIEKNPNAAIVMDIKSSESIFKQINSCGGKAIIWKTGHAFIKQKIRESNALLGGETSGHIFFADRYYGYDDAIYAAIRFIEILSKTTKSLDDMIDELPEYFITPEIKISVADNIKFKIIEQIKEDLINKKVAFNDIDGIKMNLDDANSFLLRASNTEAKIIARCESTSQEGLGKVQAELLSLLASFGLSAD